MGHRDHVRTDRLGRRAGERRRPDDDRHPEADGVVNGPAKRGSRQRSRLEVKSNQGQLRNLSLAAPAGFYVGSASSTQRERQRGRESDGQRDGPEHLREYHGHGHDHRVPQVHARIGQHVDPHRDRERRHQRLRSGDLLDHGREPVELQAACSGRRRTRSNERRLHRDGRRGSREQHGRHDVHRCDLAVDRDRPRHRRRDTFRRWRDDADNWHWPGLVQRIARQGGHRLRRWRHAARRSTAERATR